MANLLGQDIGLNYKGIITIGSTINQNVSASLQSLTDGDGNALPLQLSTSQLLMGTAYTAGYYLNVQAVFSNYASSQDETANIALFGSSQATLNSATRFGFGVYGHGYTNGSARAGGVVGEGKVTATGDTGAAVGVRGYALDTHAGGINIGLYGNAASGATNYALWMEAGNINSSVNQSWLFNANVGLSIVGATAVTPTARLHVRGDGTNPIFIAENSDGTYRQVINSTQQVYNVTSGGTFSIRPNEGTTNNPGFDFVVNTFGGASYIEFAGLRYRIGHTGANSANNGLLFQNRVVLNTINIPRFSFDNNATSITTISGTSSGLLYTDIFAAAAGSANYRPLNIAYTINNTGAQTGTTTGIFLNATETALNSMTHNLIDLQVGTVSKFKVDRAGLTTFSGVANMDVAGLTVGASRMAVVPFASNQARMRIGDTGASSLMGAYGNNAAIIQFYAPTQGSMGGAVSMLVEFTHAYTSSATGEYTHIQVNNTINHTSTGIDRLLYLKPVITASPDFRAIDVLTGSTSAHKLIRLANAASNVVFEVNAAQQIGLFGVTPIAQPTTAIASAAITPGGGGSILEDDLFAGYTVAQVVQALVNLGILKP